MELLDNSIVLECRSDGISTIGTKFKGNSVITKFNEFAYFSRVTDTVSQAFTGCRSLTNITLPGGLLEIDAYLFNGCSSLLNLIIPSTVTAIRFSAFSDCTSMQWIKCLPETPPDIATQVLVRNNAYFYVPDDCLDSYKSAWSSYSSKLKAISEFPY